MPDPVVVTAMREFKANLLAGEESQRQEMAKRYLKVERALNADIELLARELGEAREAGKSVSRARVYRLERYKHLHAQAQAQMMDYAGWAAQNITNGQEDMARRSLSDSAQAIQLSYWPSLGVQFDRLPYEAVQHMVGIAGDGKPVGALLRRRMLKDEGLIGWQKLTDELVDGTARGRNPRRTAEKMRDALTGGLQKALVIARSEQLRVYRHVGLDQYNASGVVLGQKRLPAHDGRVCVACIADDGTVYNLNQVIPDHPNGRCTSVPIVKGMPDITWSAGQDWFDQQPETIQRSIMGAERFDAYKEGRIQFAQMGGLTFDPSWGGGLRVVSLSDLLAGVQARAVPRELRRLGRIGEREATWQPVMDPLEAQGWARGTVIPETVYHGTGTTAERRIRAEGFRREVIGSSTGNAGMLGRGFYFATDKTQARNYGTRLLNVQLKVDSVMSSEAFIALAQERAFMEMLAKDQMGAPTAMAKIIQGMGFDAVDFKGEICVFDPHNIVVTGAE